MQPGTLQDSATKVGKAKQCGFSTSMDIEPYCFLLQGVDMIIKEFPENLVKLGQENSCSMFFWRADSEDGNRFRFSSSTSHKNTRVSRQVMFSLCDLRHLWTFSPRGSSPSLEQRMEA